MEKEKLKKQITFGIVLIIIGIACFMKDFVFDNREKVFSKVNLELTELLASNVQTEEESNEEQTFEEQTTETNNHEEENKEEVKQDNNYFKCTECGEYHKGDFWRHRKSHPQHKKRCNGNSGNSLCDNQYRIERLIEEVESIHQHSYDKAEDCTYKKTAKSLLQGDCHMAHQH